MQRRIYDKEQYNTEYDQRAQQGKVGTHHLGRIIAQPKEEAAHEGHEAAEESEYGQLEQVDSLVRRHSHQARHKGDEGTDERRQEDIGRVEAREPLFEREGLAHSDDRRGDERDARRIEHEEHDHGVAGRIFFGVNVLQFLHGFKAQGRSRIVEAQHIGREVHEDAAPGRVFFGHFGEEFAEEGGYGTGEQGYDAALLADPHDAQPEAHDAHQAQRHLEARFGAVEDARHESGDGRGIAQHKFDQGHGEADDEEGDPDIVEYHKVKVGFRRGMRKKGFPQVGN